MIRSSAPVSARTLSTADEPDRQLATRRSLLDAAERLFSLNGIEATSVRQIIRQAGTNLGAINYHFQTKERLALEVFARRLEPVNRARIARLDALELAAGRRKLRLEEIIDAMVRPAVESGASGPSCDDLMRLISRSFQEPNVEVKKFVEQQFAEVALRFDAAILGAIPGLPPSELFWRIHFLFGALHHGQEMWLRFEQMPRPSALVPVKPDREGFIQRIILFVTAGLSAPMPKQLLQLSAKARTTRTERRPSKSKP